MRRGIDLKRGRASFTAGLVLKVLFLAAVNGLVLVALPRMIAEEAWFGLGATVLATLALNWVYLGRRVALPARYLLPATFLLLVFSVYPVLYTIQVSFTNYSSAHNVTKEQALARILANSEEPRPDAPRYQARPLIDDGGSPALLLTDEQGQQFLGTTDGLQPLSPDQVQSLPGGQVAVEGYRQVGLAEAQANQDLFLGLRVPTEGGSIRLNTITTASLVEQTLRYDRETDTMVDLRDGTVYRAVGGTFVAEDGARLTPGWRVYIGPNNYLRVFTSPAIRGPFARVFIWNYVFATATVFLQFVVGLGIAIALNHPRLRLKRFYRSLLVIPFALPSYLTALIWGGLLNTEFGAVNRLLGANVEWLRDPTMAKVSILLVTMWLGFPYFFLVSTGALTSIPAELTEAAAVDGARPWYAFRTVKLPLLLTTLAPLLIASFAFNFNNFNAIYLLTGGGPPIVGARTPAGHTDILITYTYRLAFESGRGANYAFASAISIIIFLMIMTISIYSFRYTRAMEQVR